MECLSTSSLLEFYPNTLTSVRKTHGLDAPGRIKELVDEFEEWVKNQDNFVKKDFSRHYLETTIINSKGSLDKAKTRMNRVCLYRTELPYYFGNYDIKNDFKELDGIVHLAILPKLTKDLCRIVFLRNAGKHFQSDYLVQFTRIAIMMLDYAKCHDYSDGFIFIIDITDCSLFQLIRRIGLLELRNVAKILIDAYGLRLKGIHFITSSKIINILIWLVKQVVSMKIHGRIRVHPNMKTLAEVVPLEILPAEYGGNEKSLESLHNNWVNMMASQEFRSFMIEMTNARIKETVEKTDNKPEDLKNINID